MLIFIQPTQHIIHIYNVINMKNILIVDDAVDTRQALKSMLLNFDVNITEATDGKDGWQKIVKNHPDLVLLDIHMPQKDGITILEEIQEEWLGVPVVIVTGDEDEDMLQTCSYLGAKAVLQKPVALDELSKVMQDII